MIDAIFASRELQHKIDEIATAYSYGGQKEKLIEEMAELTVAIKHEDKPDVLPEVKRMEFHSELADVLILIWQILDVYMTLDDRFDLANAIKKKIDREVRRIRERTSASL